MAKTNSQIENAEKQGKNLTGFKPLYNSETQILILGSFPGVKSLNGMQYYAHPQNHFWKLLYSLWPEEMHPTKYEDKINWLLSKNIGVWDVYKVCQRQGSLDSRIREFELNNFKRLAKKLPHLSMIAFNGKKAYSHSLHIEKEVKCIHTLGDIKTFYLPSSSPANASYSFEKKKGIWEQCFIEAGILHST